MDLQEYCQVKERAEGAYLKAFFAECKKTARNWLFIKIFISGRHEATSAINTNIWSVAKPIVSGRYGQ